jgi:hypothetical protein
MAPYSGDNQGILTSQDQLTLVGLERQAIDLLAPALDVIANVGGEFGLTVCLQRLQDVGEGEALAPGAPDRGRSQLIKALGLSRVGRFGEDGQCRV